MSLNLKHFFLTKTPRYDCRNILTQIFEHSIKAHFISAVSYYYWDTVLSLYQEMGSEENLIKAVSVRRKAKSKSGNRNNFISITCTIIYEK